MTAVLVIPRVKPLGDRLGWTTFPDFLAHRFDERTRVVAALVSGIGYASFVGAQVLAGATLVEGAFGLSKTTPVIGMAVVIVAYTAFGGLQAVILTDTIQWIVLLVGLISRARSGAGRGDAAGVRALVGRARGMYASRLGDGWQQTNRLRDILDSGLRIGGGSDANVTPPDPLLGIHAAVNHPNEAHRLTAAEGLRMMTLDFSGLVVTTGSRGADGCPQPSAARSRQLSESAGNNERG